MSKYMSTRMWVYTCLGMMDGGNYQAGGGQAPSRTQTKEMTIANEMVGSIIGRQGSRINEIRYSIRLFTCSFEIS